MKSLRIIYLVVAVALLSGCGAAKKTAGSKSFMPCGFEYGSVSAPSLAGLDLNEKTTMVEIYSIVPLIFNPSGMAPMKFNINLETANPNRVPVTISEVEYKLYVDGLFFAEGTADTECTVAGGGSAICSVPLEFNYAPLIMDVNNTRDSALDLIWNLVGTGVSESEMRVEIKPAYIFKGRQTPPPEYVPVSFICGM